MRKYYKGDIKEWTNWEELFTRNSTNETLNLISCQSWRTAPNIEHTNMIPANADLNDYLTPGTYCCLSGNIAKTLINTPYTHGNFKLIVIQNTGSDTSNTEKWLSQLLISSMNFIAIRGYNGSDGFSTWYNLGGATRINNDWSTLEGTFTTIKDTLDTNLSSQFPNVYDFGTVYTSGLGTDYFKYQIYIPDKLTMGDEGIYLRTYYKNETNSEKWRDWKCIHINDYKSKSIAANGWIIFHNGLIIQWGNTLIYTRDKISDNVANVMDTTNPNYIVFPLSLISFSHSGWDYQHISLEHTTDGNDNLTTAKLFGELKKSTTGFVVNVINCNIMNLTVLNANSISLNWICMSFV